MKYDVVIVAAGKGVRAGLGYNKVFYELEENKMVIDEAMHLFVEDNDCQNIIVVTNKDDFSKVKGNIKLILVEGGKERKDSVLNGLNQVKSEYVLIHDAARPFLKKEALEDIKKTVVEKKACILAHKAIDTIKMVVDGKIEKTIDRKMIYMAETPQAFLTSLIKEAYQNKEEINYTDDAMLLEKMGIDVYVVESVYDNHKLTNNSDFKK